MYCSCPILESFIVFSFSLVFSPDMSIPVLAVSIQPGSRLKSEGNILIHLYSWLTSQLIRVIDMGLPSDASEVCMVFSPHGRLN